MTTRHLFRWSVGWARTILLRLLAVVIAFTGFTFSLAIWGLIAPIWALLLSPVVVIVTLIVALIFTAKAEPINLFRFRAPEPATLCGAHEIERREMERYSNLLLVPLDSVPADYRILQFTFRVDVPERPAYRLLRWKPNRLRIYGQFSDEEVRRFGAEAYAHLQATGSLPKPERKGYGGWTLDESHFGVPNPVIHLRYDLEGMPRYPLRADRFRYESGTIVLTVAVRRDQTTLCRGLPFGETQHELLCDVEDRVVGLKDPEIAPDATSGVVHSMVEQRRSAGSPNPVRVATRTAPWKTAAEGGACAPQTDGEHATSRVVQERLAQKRAREEGTGVQEGDDGINC